MLLREWCVCSHAVLNRAKTAVGGGLRSSSGQWEVAILDSCVSLESGGMKAQLAFLCYDCKALQWLPGVR